MKAPAPPLIRLLALLCRVTIGGLFVFAAVAKLLPADTYTFGGTTVKTVGPQQFFFSIRAFELLPDHLERLGTFAIPWTEGLCGVCLILGLWTRAAAWMLSAALAAFIAAILSALQRHLSVSCGCFGSFKLFCGDVLGWCNVWQDAVMLGMALIPALFGPGYLAADGLRRCRSTAAPGADPAVAPAAPPPSKAARPG